MKLSTITAILLLGATSLLAEGPFVDENEMNRALLTQAELDEQEATIVDEAMKENMALQEEEKELTLANGSVQSNELGTDAAGNTSYGTDAGKDATGNFNDFYGYGSGRKTSGEHNTMLGFASGYTENTSSDYNVFVGSYSGYKEKTGNRNTFIGSNRGGEHALSKS